jgi:hypothetical protein
LSLMALCNPLKAIAWSFLARYFLRYGYSANSKSPLETSSPGAGMNPSLPPKFTASRSTKHVVISSRCPRGDSNPRTGNKLGSTDLQSKSGRTKCGPERQRGTSGCPQPRAIPLSPWHRDRSTEYQPLRLSKRRFEPSNMKQDGFDNLAEQSWTREARSRASARDEVLSEQSLSLRQFSESASVIFFFTKAS